MGDMPASDDGRNLEETVRELREGLVNAWAESDELLDRVEELSAKIDEIVAAADKLCDMKSAVWMDEALQAADDLQALLRHVEATT